MNTGEYVNDYLTEKENITVIKFTGSLQPHRQLEVEIVLEKKFYTFAFLGGTLLVYVKSTTLFNLLIISI